MDRAKTAATYDPLTESISIYLDTIIIFEKLLMIFMMNKKK
jgi:hypothetical protein